MGAHFNIYPNIMGLKQLFAEKLAVSADIVHSNADNIRASADNSGLTADIKDHSAVAGRNRTYKIIRNKNCLKA